MRIPSLSTFFTKGMDRISRTDFAQKYIGLTAPAAIGTITTLSCATKDAVNCWYYVRQSLNNKKIPDDKRAFVAGLDLANGILNVSLQLALGLWFNKKVLPNFFDDTIAPKFFSDKLYKTFMENPNLKFSEEAAKAIAGNLKKAGKVGLIALSTLLLTQVVIKRMVVPSISTPMATYFKNKMDKKDGNNNASTNGDVVTFENGNALSQSDKNELNKNLPDCFKSFMK